MRDCLDEVSLWACVVGNCLNCIGYYSWEDPSAVALQVRNCGKVEKRLSKL